MKGMPFAASRCPSGSTCSRRTKLILPESSFSDEKLHANVSGSEVTFSTIAVSSVGFVTIPYPETEIRTGRPDALLFQRIGAGIGALPQDSETASIETEYEQAHRVVFRIPEADAEHGRRTDESLQQKSFHTIRFIPSDRPGS